MAKLGAVIAVVLVVCAASGCGGGSSPSAEVSSFVVGYVDHDTDSCCETGMHARVSHVTFARSDPHWAAVSIAVTAATGQPDGTDYLVVRKAGSAWQVVGFGKGAIGCRVPARIRAELAKRAPKGVLSCSTP
jgi:hypothetical protein